jgi:hypothetical protein
MRVRTGPQTKNKMYSPISISNTTLVETPVNVLAILQESMQRAELYLKLWMAKAVRGFDSQIAEATEPRNLGSQRVHRIDSESCAEFLNAKNTGRARFM